MVVQRVKSLVERLLALGAEIALASIWGFTMFMGARMTAKPTFHRSCLKVNISLLYLTHHFLMHYPVSSISCALENGLSLFSAIAN